MTVAELIERLQGLPGNAVVVAYDKSAGAPMPVTGYVLQIPPLADRESSPGLPSVLTLQTNWTF